MKAYQVKIGKRGEQVAQLFIVEAVDYKNAIINAISKYAEIAQCKIEECCVFDLHFIEETAPLKDDKEIVKEFKEGMDKLQGLDIDSAGERTMEFKQPSKF